MSDVENSGIISQKLHMIVGIREKMLTLAKVQNSKSNEIEDGIPSVRIENTVA